MQQRKNSEMTVNAHISPWSPKIPTINQDLTEVEDSLRTNAMMIKDFVRKEKLLKLGNLDKKLLLIPNSVRTLQYLKKLKDSTIITSKIIQNNAKEQLTESRKPLGKFKKSIKEIVSRNHHSRERNLELLTKLAELKQSGIITQKEFDSKKKEILAKI